MSKSLLSKLVYMALASTCVAASTQAAYAAKELEPGSPAAVLCYTLAADPDDPQTVAFYPGVKDSALTSASTAACSIASQADPSNPQIRYLFGRASLAQKSYSSALVEFEAAATAGYGAAERALGNMYWQGRGVTRDEAQAIEHFSRAAELGEPQGLVAAIRDKVTNGASLDAVLALLQKAALSGSTEAWKMIGQLYMENPGDVASSDVEHALMLGFALDSPEASLELGRLYDRSGDAAAALAIYTQRVAKNDPAAMWEMSLRTEGDVSAQWLLAAANREQPDAMYALALAYKDGQKGVTADRAAYLDWLNRAALADNASAMIDLGFVALDEKPYDYTAAKKWFEKAISQRADKRAYLGLAYIYDRGAGVDEDDRLATEQYTSAIEAGDTAYGYFYRARILDKTDAPDAAANAAADLMSASADGPVAASAMAGFREFSKATRVAVQELLTAGGFYSGKIDGVFGPRAIQGFNDHLAK